MKQARTAFNWQIGESIEIQNNKHHHILNSKSGYNRYSLPRLSAKLAEVTLASLEKEKREEKEQEDEIKRKIRQLKLQRSSQRRETPGNMEQQEAGKKRSGRRPNKNAPNVQNT